MGVALSEEANVLISIWGFSDTSKARRFGAKSQKIKGKSVWEAKFSRGAPAPQTPSHRLVEGRCAALRISYPGRHHHTRQPGWWSRRPGRKTGGTQQRGLER